MIKKGQSGNFTFIPVISGKCTTLFGVYDVYKMDRESHEDFLKLSDVKEIERTYREKIEKLQAELDKEAKKPLIAYKCDGLKCFHCSKECTHTFDIRYAKNFKKVDIGIYEERVSSNELSKTMEKLSKTMEKATNAILISCKDSTITKQKLEIETLKKEIEELKATKETIKNYGLYRAYKVIDFDNKEYHIWLSKLQEAIEIIKKVLNLPIDNDYWLDKDDNRNYRLDIKRLLTEQEYELLKEVLENDTNA